MIIVAPSLEQILTTNVASGTISFLDKTTHPRNASGPPPGPPPGGASPPPGPPPNAGPVWEQTLVAVGGGTEGFDVNPNGREIWAADARDGTIAVIDIASKKLVQRLDAKVPSANRLKFSPDGKWVFVSSLRAGELTVFDAASRAESKRIPVGHGASGILVQPDSSRVFVSCSPDGYVAVVDVRSMAVVGKIPAGNEPDGLAWASPPAR
jgi:DNA-binding beta-propeller fold protein YncE